METDIRKLAKKVKADFAGLPESYRTDLEPVLSSYLMIGEEPQTIHGIRAFIWDAVKLAVAIDMLPKK